MWVFQHTQKKVLKLAWEEDAFPLFVGELVSWWAQTLTYHVTGAGNVFHSWGFIPQVFSSWLKTPEVQSEWQGYTHTLLCSYMQHCRKNLRGKKKHGRNTSAGISGKPMGLTAARCRQLVLQHDEQDQSKKDESPAITEWTSQEGKSLKVRTGRGSRGKVEGDKES